MAAPETFAPPSAVGARAERAGAVPARATEAVGVAAQSVASVPAPAGAVPPAATGRPTYSDTPAPSATAPPVAATTVSRRRVLWPARTAPPVTFGVRVWGATPVAANPPVISTGTPRPDTALPPVASASAEALTNRGRCVPVPPASLVRTNRVSPESYATRTRS